MVFRVSTSSRTPSGLSQRRRSSAPFDHPLPGSREVETGKAQRKRGRRGSGTVQRIQDTARERQAAWTETDQANRTFRLTGELDGLYGVYRDEQTGTLTAPFYGTVSAVRL